MQFNIGFNRKHEYELQVKQFQQNSNNNTILKLFGR